MPFPLLLLFRSLFSSFPFWGSPFHSHFTRTPYLSGSQFFFTPRFLFSTFSVILVFLTFQFHRQLGFRILLCDFYSCFLIYCVCEQLFLTIFLSFLFLFGVLHLLFFFDYHFDPQLFPSSFLTLSALLSVCISSKSSFKTTLQVSLTCTIRKHSWQTYLRYFHPILM